MHRPHFPGHITTALVGLLALVLSQAPARAATVTWDGSTDMTWAQPDGTSWGGATYQSGDTAVFAGAGTGTVTISGSVSPAATSITSGSYTFSGGDISSGSLAKSGSGTATFTGSLSFAGGASVSGGTLTMNPASAGTYSLGSGTIAVNGGSLKLVGPTTGSTTLANNLSIGASGGTLLWDVGSSTSNPAVFSGDITLNGQLILGNAHAYQPMRPMQLTGTIYLNGANRTISSWNQPSYSTAPQIMGSVNGAGTYSLNIGQGWIRGITIGGAGGWDIKDLNSSIDEMWVTPTTDSTDFFSGIRGNGGKVNVAKGQSNVGVLHLLGGGFHFGDFSMNDNGARVEIALSSGRTVNSLGGTITATNFQNGVWLTPGTGTLAGSVVVGTGGVLRAVAAPGGIVTEQTLKYTGGDLQFTGGATLLLASGPGDWNTQMRLKLQAQASGDRFVLGDGNGATPETVTLTGASNVPYNSPTSNTRGFIFQFGNYVDDGNVVLRYETPTSNPFIGASATTTNSTYNSSDRLIVGWSDRTSSTIQYSFRGGSAGTEFVPRVAGITVLGPTAGTVFTAASPTTVTVPGTVSFYRSDANMDRSANLGAVAIAAGGTLCPAVAGATVEALSVAVQAGGVLGGNGLVKAPVTVQADGAVAPGMSNGTLTVDSVTFAADSIYQWEMQHPWGMNDDLLVTNGTGATTLTFPSAMTFDLRNLGDTAGLGDEFVLFRYTGNDPTLPATLTWLTGNSPNPITAAAPLLTLDPVGKQIILSGITAIPEPSGLALLALAGAALVRGRGRRP